MFKVSSVCHHTSIVYKPSSRQLANPWGKDARPKEKPTFLIGRRNTPTFKHYARLGYQQVFGYEKYRNAKLFKKVSEGMKEGGCVYTNEQVCNRWTMRKKQSCFLYFDVINNMLSMLIRTCTAACKQEY